MTILSAIRETFGEDLSPDLIHASRQWSRQEIKNLVSKYSEFQCDVRCPTKTTETLRPFIHHNHLQLGILPLDFEDFAKRQPSLQEDALKKYLLYCHSICISDPGEFVLRLAATRGGLGEGVLQNYLEFLNYIKELIENEVVILVDDWPLGMAYFNKLQGKPVSTRGRRMVQDPQRIVSFSWPPGFRRNANSEDPDTTRISLFAKEDSKLDRRRKRLLLNAIDVSLIADELFERNIDLYFNTTSDLELFSEYAHYLKKTTQVKQGELRTLENLVSLEVPEIANLSIADAIAIRESAESFERLRNALGKASRRLVDLPADTLNRSHEEIRLLNQELYEIRLSVDDEVSQSKLLSGAKRGARSFAIGGVVALGLAYWFPPAAALVKGGAVMALDLLLSSVGRSLKRDEAESKEALLRHFYVFQPNSG